MQVGIQRNVAIGGARKRAEQLNPSSGQPRVQPHSWIADVVLVFELVGPPIAHARQVPERVSGRRLDPHAAQEPSDHHVLIERRQYVGKCDSGLTPFEQKRAGVIRTGSRRSAAPFSHRAKPEGRRPRALPPRGATRPSVRPGHRRDPTPGPPTMRSRRADTASPPPATSGARARPRSPAGQPSILGVASPRHRTSRRRARDPLETQTPRLHILNVRSARLADAELAAGRTALAFAGRSGTAARRPRQRPDRG